MLRLSVQRSHRQCFLASEVKDQKVQEVMAEALRRTSCNQDESEQLQRRRADVQAQLHGGFLTSFQPLVVSFSQLG